MKPFCCLIIVFVTCQSAFCQYRMQAKDSDTVWVIVNHVKADKRNQYENFIEKVFWPGASKLTAADQKVFKQTRVLNAVKPDSDGTYSYLFIMDPVLKGGQYEILPLLTKMYGATKAEEYFKNFQDSMMGESTNYEVVQSKN